MTGFALTWLSGNKKLSSMVLNSKVKFSSMEFHKAVSEVPLFFLSTLMIYTTVRLHQIIISQMTPISSTSVMITKLFNQISLFLLTSNQSKSEKIRLENIRNIGKYFCSPHLPNNLNEMSYKQLNEDLRSNILKRSAV